MTRSHLTLARAPKKQSLALAKKAIRLFRSKSVPREVWKSNARKWIAAMNRMGSKHVLRGYEVTWGQAGNPCVRQVMAPRRMGERA